MPASAADHPGAFVETKAGNAGAFTQLLQRLETHSRRELSAQHVELKEVGEAGRLFNFKPALQRFLQAFREQGIGGHVVEHVCQRPCVRAIGWFGGNSHGLLHARRRKRTASGLAVRYAGLGIGSGSLGACGQGFKLCCCPANCVGHAWPVTLMALAIMGR